MRKNNWEIGVVDFCSIHWLLYRFKKIFTISDFFNAYDFVIISKYYLGLFLMFFEFH